MNQTKSPPVIKKKMILSSKLQPITAAPLNSKEKKTKKEIDLLQSNIASINISQHGSDAKRSNFPSASNPSIHSFAESERVKPERFNPFDEDDELISSSYSGEHESLPTSDSPTDGLAELGVTEDHFSMGEGMLGLSSVEELNIVIENCKGMILTLPNDSEKRKKLVENLVKLKIKLQELKESSALKKSNVKSVLSHQFFLQKSRSLKSFCDCCKGSMWSLIPAWYECKECLFICHKKCIDSVRRVCVAQAAKTGAYQYKICPEVGLSKQLYCCMECKNPIVVGPGNNPAHLCDYSGYYYCSNCHWDDLMVIPARVIHNWDHSLQKVCRQSFQLLSKMYHRPIINIEAINPKLFNYVEELAELQRMRRNILKMKDYFLACASALEAKLLRKLEDRQHFIDNSYMYSMNDLVQLNNGSLTDELVRIHGFYAKHIKLDCLVCQGKGFICEICNSGEALFPFDMMISICSKCSAVFHSDCFSFVDKSCPRCKRKQEKRKASVSFNFGEESD